MLKMIKLKIEILSTPISGEDINATVNAKKLFQSCMNEDLLFKIGEDRFKKIVTEELDGWPLIGIPSNNKTILDKMVSMRKFGFKPLFDLQITLNPRDTQYLILKVKKILNVH